MIIDTHIHLHDKAFDAEREELIRSFREQGIGLIVDIAAEKDSLAKVTALAEEYDFIYGALGFHPDEVGDLDEEAEAYIRTHLSDPKIVAVGEIGLDYHWMTQPKEVQAEAFVKQMKIAEEYGLPIMVHSREAAEDTMRLIRSEAAALRQAIAKRRQGTVPRPLSPYGEGNPDGICPGIIHCYSYSAEQAREYVSMGFMIGVGGVVTYKNGRKLKEVVREIPLANIVLETDAPYLAPTPHRGERNDSRYLRYVAAEIAELKGVSKEKVIEKTAGNALRILGLSDKLIFSS